MDLDDAFISAACLLLLCSLASCVVWPATTLPINLTDPDHLCSAQLAAAAAGCAVPESTSNRRGGLFTLLCCLCCCCPVCCAAAGCITYLCCRPCTYHFYFYLSISCPRYCCIYIYLLTYTLLIKMRRFAAGTL